MSTAAKPVESHRDAHEMVKRAKNFSLKLPVVGTVRVPPPDQLAFYGALGVLAAVNVIDWPVALAVGVGQAIVARHFSDRAEATAKEVPASHTESTQSAEPPKETPAAAPKTGESASGGKASRAAHSS